MSSPIIRCIVGAAAGLAVGAVLGLLVIPLLTQQWLFTTSAAIIRPVSGPTFAVLGAWLGAVLAVVRFDRGSVPSSKRMPGRATWLPVAVSSLAVLFATALWLESAVTAVHELIAVFFPEPVPSFAPFWVLLVYSIGAIVAALWLHSCARQDREQKRRTVTVVELALTVLAICLVAAWLLAGRWFALFWAI